MRAEPSVDFEALFEHAPGSYLVLTPDLTIAAVSDAYLAATMTRREDILGRRLFEVFDPAADGVQDLRASLERVLAGHSPDTLTVQRYDVRRPTEEGAFEVRYWRSTSSSVAGADGKIAWILHQTEDVTEVARTSDERYRDLLEAAPDAMLVIDRDSRIEIVNVQAEKLFGYSREELIGQPLELLVPIALRSKHGDFMRRYFAEPTLRAMRSGSELAGRRKDGTEVPIEVSLGPVRADRGIAVLAAVRDISDRRRLAAATTVMAQRLTSAVENITDAFVLFDEEEELVLCNAAWRRLLGFTSEVTFSGKPYVASLDALVERLVFDDEESRTRFRAERLTATGEADARTRDGHVLRIATRRFEGGIVVTVWDLTDDERRAEELRQAHAAAAAGSAAKTEFLSSMSHELRTPLNAVLGFAQLLERDKRQPLTPRQHERVQRILHGGEQLLRLVDDVLDLARIEAGRVAMSVEPVAIDDVLAEVKRTLEPMEVRYGIPIVLAPHPAATPLVAVDRMRYAQILINFCSNALKYNRPGGSVRVAVEVAADHRVRATVTDSGLGIPRAKQALLFQPFQRAGQETGPIEGTGIGLVVTRKLAMLMNAEVGFESVEGRGSSFWVEVPAHVATKRATERPMFSKLPARLSEGDGRRRQVLYVEDNPANVAFVEEVVEMLDGVELLSAPSGEIGVELALRHRPDVILMDINLAGGMSGFEALSVLKRSEAKDIPVIAVTAAAALRDRERGIAAGFDRYLTKPIDVDELIAELDRVFAPKS